MSGAGVRLRRSRCGARRAPARRQTGKCEVMLYGWQQDYDVLAGPPSDKPAMSQEDIAKTHEYMGEFHQKLVESGELVDAQGLTAPVHARRVRLKGGAPVVTDGPYPE